MSIVAEIPGYFQAFSDGTVKRFFPETSPPSSEASNGYLSKDLTIDPSKPITARIFLPTTTTTAAATTPLPLIVYFHGGGFCFGSTAWGGYDRFLADLSVASQSLVASVDYRLAPEHRLPAAYDDCLSALRWLALHAASDPWLRRADLRRTFFSGDSAGANIAHHVALRALRDELCNLHVRGLVLIHPFFGSERRVDSEVAAEAAETVALHDAIWGLSLPEGAGRDYFGCNYETAVEEEEAGEGEWRRFPDAVVCVAGRDFLRERGVLYGEFLRRKGVGEVRVVEEEEEDHVFHVFQPDSAATRRLQRQMSEFVNGF